MMVFQKRWREGMGIFFFCFWLQWHVAAQSGHRGNGWCQGRRGIDARMGEGGRYAGMAPA